MIVWIAGRGERCEGSHVLGIFSTRESAVKCALAEEAHFGDNTWKLEIDDSTPDSYWTNGCDYVYVSKYTVSE